MKNIPAIFLIFFYTTQLTAQYLQQPYYTWSRTDEQHLDLSTDWELTHRKDSISSPDALSSRQWITVPTPTSVHWALYQAQQGPNPYIGTNAQAMEWVDSVVWYYRKSFSVDRHPDKKFSILSFDGLDYFSKVWLNGHLLGRHEGMFGGPYVEVDSLITTDAPNELLVEVKAANYGRWDTYEPQKNPGRVIKPIAHAGGTGAEPFFAVGMWRGARLDFLPETHLARPYLTTTRISDIQDTAYLKLEIEVLAGRHSLEYEMHPWNNQILSRGPINQDIQAWPGKYELLVALTDKDARTHTQRLPLDLLAGRNWTEIDIVVPDPELWFPVGMKGQPHLYQVQLTLMHDNQPVDQINFNHGIRHIETTATTGPRVSERWDDWQFAVNNQPLFVKGVNWMPVDLLYDLPREKYRWLLIIARDMGVQMLRVWGGGLMETDDFYDLCDSLGIMVWQDFTIWHQDTPDWPADVWEEQVMHSVFRLRNRASLALWCGGNGFNPYSFGSSKTMGVLERILTDFDPSHPFVRTSSDAGNVHVYPDMDPSGYGHAFRYVPFISETGMHSIPNPKGLERVISSDELDDLDSLYGDKFAQSHPEIISHFVEYDPERVPRMLSRASHILDVGNPSLADLAEATQVGSGEFYQILSEEVQANYPATSGLLPWVFKRPWPVFSAIMLVDGFGQPSAPYYFMKRTYESTHVALDFPHLLWAPGQLMSFAPIVIHQGEAIEQSHQLEITLYDDSFNQMHTKTVLVDSLLAGPSVFRGSVVEFNIPRDYQDRYIFAKAVLKSSEGKSISQSVYWPRSLSMLKDSVVRVSHQTPPEPYRQPVQPWPTLEKGPWLKPVVNQTRTQLQAELLSYENDSDTNFTIIVRNVGQVPAFMCSVNVENIENPFVVSDNFFWLSPGEEKEITGKIVKGQFVPKKLTTINVGAWNANSVLIKPSE
ncbi:MAG: beta-mannosidase [Tunicatimonas sp.]